MNNLYHIFLLFWVCAATSVKAWGSSSKVKLVDVKTLTLYHGKMTTGGRSPPVPQLQCVGGTAGCGAFVPQVVQCYNKGSDGFDVQWECKTDMDNAYRFGRVDVICEGYDYPDDPYILKGSCGLEYTIDLTEEGIKKKGSHNYYGSQSSYFGSSGHAYQTPAYKPAKSTGFGDVILFALVLFLIYALYKTCLRSTQYSTTDDDYDTPDSRFSSGYSGFGASAPPPPGFRPGYTPDAGCGSSYRSAGTGGTGNFWSGAMTGGLLGYMFGSRANRGYEPGYFRQPTASSSWSAPSTSGSSSSSGTRTASGYGGTRRR